jgi:hypothetical protein
MGSIGIVLCVLTAILALANIVAWWRMRPKQQQEPLYHFNCPKCNRRLRYRARQAGNPGMCPRCRDRWTFPPIPAPTRR